MEKKNILFTLMGNQASSQQHVGFDVKPSGAVMKTTVKNINDILESFRGELCSRDSDALPSLLQIALEQMLFLNQQAPVSCTNLENRLIQLTDQLSNLPTMQTTPGLNTLLANNVELLTEIIKAWNREICPSGENVVSEIRLKNLFQELYDSICNKEKRVQLQARNITEDDLQGLALEFYRLSLSRSVKIKIRPEPAPTPVEMTPGPAQSTPREQSNSGTDAGI